MRWLCLILCAGAAPAGGHVMQYNPLTPEEERVLIHKGTERPFSGEYAGHWQPGTYICKRCNAPLYQSDSKFDAGCGWPSFDQEIRGSVRRQPDADGRRTEIACHNCGAHLGHVFVGEGFTPNNTRHCVNSISLKFIPATAAVQTETAYFAGGCFWGTEYFFEKAPGVVSARVGYMGGRLANPTYQQVCTGNTGHAEAVEVVFDPTVTSYEEIGRLFFEIHDPTQVNRQGPDIGAQYRSAVFYANETQKTVALRLIGELEAKGYGVATEVAPAHTFWPAEEYHQDYCRKTGKLPYCHVRTDRF